MPQSGGGQGAVWRALHGLSIEAGVPRVDRAGIGVGRSPACRWEPGWAVPGSVGAGMDGRWPAAARAGVGGRWRGGASRSVGFSRNQGRGPHGRPSGMAPHSRPEGPYRNRSPWDHKM